MENIPLYDEKALLQQVAEGDEVAFGKLFHRWQPFLASHIFRVTESKPIAEEIVQDVFLKIWESRETLSGIVNFRGYLLVISKNMAINALQKIAREARNLEKYAKESRPGQEEADPKTALYSLIDEAIDQLSPRQKEVYLLHRHQRMTYLQIAGHLGIGKESVKTHLELAVRHISKYVKGKLTIMVVLLLLQG